MTLANVASGTCLTHCIRYASPERLQLCRQMPLKLFRCQTDLSSHSQLTMESAWDGIKSGSHHVAPEFADSQTGVE